MVSVVRISIELTGLTEQVTVRKHRGPTVFHHFSEGKRLVRFLVQFPSVVNGTIAIAEVETFVIGTMEHI